MRKVAISDDNAPVQLEAGQVIINKQASKKHWRELSKINQSAGDGLPIHEPKFKRGGEVDSLPPKGELVNKDNFLLRYEKKGSNYEFFVYKPITKEVSAYNQTKRVCINKDCPQKMTYKQFVNYLYAELYLDDRKYAKGGCFSYEIGGMV